VDGVLVTVRLEARAVLVKVQTMAALMPLAGVAGWVSWKDVPEPEAIVAPVWSTQEYVVV
jgi:hypothetical protein